MSPHADTAPPPPAPEGIAAPMQPSPSRPHLLDHLTLLIAPLILWGPSFFGYVAYLDDTLIFSMPLKVEWAAQVLHGAFPFWSEKIGAGYPVFAESQIGALFPLNVFFLLSWAPAIAYGLFAIACAWLAGYGYYAIARRFVASRLLQLTGAVLYASTGFSFFHWSHLNVLAVLALLPWFVHFSLRWTETGRRSPFVAGAVCGALIVFAGHPQFAMAAYLTLALFWMAFDRSRWPLRIGRLLTMIAAAAGLSAVQWIPTLALAEISARSLAPTAWIEGGALSARDLLTPLFPLIAVRQPYNAHTAIELSITSIGSFLALFSSFHVRSNPTVRRLWGIVVISYAVGTSGGYGLISSFIPLLKEIRDVQRFALPAFFCLPILAALAIEGSVHRPPKRRFTEAAAVLAFVIILTFLWQLSGAFVHWIVFAVVTIVWILPLKSRRAWLAGAVLLEVAVWAIAFARFGYVPADTLAGPLTPQPPVGRIAVSLPYHENPVKTIFQKMVEKPVPALSWLYVPQAPLIQGVSSAQSDLQLNAPWFPGIGSYPWNFWVLDPDRPLLDFLRLAGVTHLVSATGRFSLPEEGAADVFDDLRAHLFRMSDPVTNVKFYPASAVEFVPDDDAKIVGKVLAPHAPLMHTLYLVSDEPLELPGEGNEKTASPLPAGEFEVNRFTYSGSRLSITGTAARAGYLFISATYAPGWTARSNGSPALLYRAQYQFMAVPVSPGIVALDLRYAPPGFTTGLSISILCILALCALLFATPPFRSRSSHH